MFGGGVPDLSIIAASIIFWPWTGPGKRRSAKEASGSTRPPRPSAGGDFALPPDASRPGKTLAVGAMDWLLRILITRLVRHGNLRLTTARGTVLTFGDGSAPPVAARFTSVRAELGVLLEPDLKLG